MSIGNLRFDQLCENIGNILDFVSSFRNMSETKTLVNIMQFTEYLQVNGSAISLIYHFVCQLWYFFSYKTEFFFSFQNNPNNLDGSRSLILFREGKTHMVAKFQKTDLVLRSNHRLVKTMSYSQINTV